jgi:2-dehydro-3-deoxyglucarate aldolase
MRRDGNGVTELFEAGEVAYGGVAATASPKVVEAFGDLGLDFVWVDLEHAGPSPWDADVLGDLTRAAEAGGTDLLVRIPKPDPPMVRKVLDAGVRNLMVPRVETAAEVRRAVEAAHYRYDDGVGDRGLAGARSDAWGAVEDYTRREDDAVLVGATIENPTAVENIEDILSVPELGFVFIGFEDLSMSLGHPREFEHPEVQRHAETVRQSALDAGVPPGRACMDEGDPERLPEEGFQLLNLASELAASRAHLAEMLPE